VNWVDAVIIVIALIGAYIGYKQGLIRAVFSVIGLIAGVAIAGRYSPGGAEWAYIVSFILIVVAILIAANLIGAVIIKRFIKFIMMGWLDSLGGAVLGLFVGALLVAAILSAVVNWEAAQPFVSGVEKAIDDSPLANLLMEKLALLRGLLPEEFDQALEKVLG